MSNVANVIHKGRLGPGQMICADVSAGTFKENAEIAKDVATREPYAEWVRGSTRLEDLSAVRFQDKSLMSAKAVWTPSMCP